MLSFPVRNGPRDQSAREAQSRQPQGGPALAEYGQSLVPPLQLPPAVSSKAPRVKKAAPDIRRRPRAHAGARSVLAARQAPRRELNATITCKSLERCLDDEA